MAGKAPTLHDWWSDDFLDRNTQPVDDESSEGSLDKDDRGKGKGKGKQRDGNLEDRGSKDRIIKMSDWWSDDFLDRNTQPVDDESSEEILDGNTETFKFIRENQKNVAYTRYSLIRSQNSWFRDFSDRNTQPVYDESSEEILKENTETFKSIREKQENVAHGIFPLIRSPYWGFDDSLDRNTQPVDDESSKEISPYLDCLQLEKRQNGPGKCLLYSLEYLDCAGVCCHLESKRSLNCSNTFKHAQGSSTMQCVMDLTKEAETCGKADVPIDACCRLHGMQRIIEEYFEYTKTETDVNCTFENKETLLHFSIRTNNLILSAFLLHINADLTVANSANKSPLQLVSKNEIQFTKDIIERVIYKKICKQNNADIQIVRIALCLSTKTNEFVIVVFQSGSAISTASEYNGLEIIWKLFFGADDEGHVISNYIKTIEIANVLPRIPSHLAQKLFNEHSNLTMISPSSVTSSGYKSEDHVIRKSVCVVLYCKAKGYKPVGENLFPKQLCGYRTDVREGYCQFGMTENLQIGSPISKNIWGGSYKTGTIGGFIELGQNKTGMITCSHVLYSLTELQDRALRPRINVTSPPNAFDCGLVREARFVCDNPNVVSVDASLVEVTSSFPASGSFPEIDEFQLRATGFSKQNPPVFSSGEVMLDIPDDCRRNHVVKYGHTTKFTSGTLTLEFSHVRCENIDLSVDERTPFNPNMIKSFKMFHQNEIYSRNSEKFFDSGDSGAFVYLLKDNNERHLKCIGMAIGNTSYNTCIMTPIKPVLDAFKLPYTLKVFPSELSSVGVGTSQVSSTEGHDKLDLILSAVQLSNNKLQKLDSIENRIQNIERRVTTLERQNNGHRNDIDHATSSRSSVSLDCSGYNTDA